MLVDVSHDHGDAVNGVAVYMRDGDRQAFPGRPHFRVRDENRGKMIWLSGIGYAVRIAAADVHHYVAIRNGKELQSTRRTISSSRSLQVFQQCDPDAFDCGPSGGGPGGGWNWPTGCGEDGYQPCEKGCPDYTCTGPYSPGDGTQYCGTYSDGTCGDTVLVRWFPGMWIPGTQGPGGGEYMGDLVCSISLTTFDALCESSGANSNRFWPPIVNLFANYQATATNGLLTCRAWDKSANVFVAGFTSVNGRVFMGEYQVNAGTIFSARISIVPAGPNTSGLGAQYFPRTPVPQTAVCSGSGSYPS